MHQLVRLFLAKQQLSVNHNFSLLPFALHLTYLSLLIGDLDAVKMLTCAGGDLYALSSDKRSALGIRTLPGCAEHRSWTKVAAASTYSTGRRSGYTVLAASVTSISGTSLLSLFQKDIALVGAANAVALFLYAAGNEQPFLLMFRRICTS